MIETKLSITDSMQSGFQMWKKHFNKIMLVGLMVYIPTQICIELVSIWLDNALSLDENPNHIRLANSIYNIIRHLIGSIALLGILNFIINQLENEKEITTKEIITTGLNRWGTFIGVGILAGIKIFVYLFLLIIPGIHKSVKLSFIDCIVATNNNKFKDECVESEELVKNHWWKVFGFLIFIFSIQLLLEIVFAVPLLYFEGYQYLTIIMGVIVSLLGTYFIVVRAIFFFNLKQIKNESIREIESIAANEKVETYFA